MQLDDLRTFLYLIKFRHRVPGVRRCLVPAQRLASVRRDASPPAIHLAEHVLGVRLAGVGKWCQQHGRAGVVAGVIGLPRLP